MARREEGLSLSKLGHSRTHKRLLYSILDAARPSQARSRDAGSGHLDIPIHGLCFIEDT